MSNPKLPNTIPISFPITGYLFRQLPLAAHAQAIFGHVSSL
ncbi:hypothetical protein KSS87_003924 [Heliosperma pusillum]|nr:hypothetical protein KSS87_003924 [Heliosperma pusillum]